MSETQSMPSQADRLASRGITETASGHLRLPPVLVEYADGTSQRLLLEVGQRDTEISLTPATLLTDSLLNRGQRTFVNGLPAPSVPVGRSQAVAMPLSALNVPTQGATADDANNGATTRTEGSASTNGTPAPARSARTTRSATRNNSQRTPTTGVRGIHYPAFDVSREGVYRDEQRHSAILNELMGPIQRALESSVPAQTRLPHPLSTSSSEGSSSSEMSRNIILTVNYIYGQSPVSNDNNATNAGRNNRDGSSEGITGSLILHVPSINENSDENLQVLVRLATIIALRTISTSIKKASGVPERVFESFEVKKLSEMSETESQCAICYDKYEDVASVSACTATSCSNRKRCREDDSQTSKSKRQRKSDKTKKEKGSDNNAHEPPCKEYSHVPVAMPCGHIFGQSCLYEWLKTNNSCPLCRARIKETRGSETGYATTVVLPNLAQVISDSREVIEGFNSRRLTFLLPDQDNSEADDTNQEIPMPAAFPLRLPTILTLNPNREGGVDAAEESSTGPEHHDNPGVLNLVRNLIQNLGDRFRRPVRMSNDPVAAAQLRHGFIDRLPIVRSVHNPERPTMVLRSRRTRRASTGDDSFFPAGVASRRTANGVVTRNIGAEDEGDDDDDTSESWHAQAEDHGE